VIRFDSGAEQAMFWAAFALVLAIWACAELILEEDAETPVDGFR